MNKNVCAFTGHRCQNIQERFDDKSSFVLEIKNKLKEEIEYSINELHCDTFMSGMALGIDLWAAQAVLDLKQKYPNIKLYCVVPCKTQSDKWNSYYKWRYQNILNRADEIIYTGSVYTKECMKIRNEYLINYADVLIAVFDKTKQTSGTAQTLRLAGKKNIKTLIIDLNELERNLKDE